MPRAGGHVGQGRWEIVETQTQTIRYSDWVWRNKGRGLLYLAHPDWISQGGVLGNFPVGRKRPNSRQIPAIDWLAGWLAEGCRGALESSGGYGRGRVLGEDVGYGRMVRQRPGISGSRRSSPRGVGADLSRVGPGAVVGAPRLWLRH